MSENKNIKGLEINQNYELQKLLWKFKRIGWVVLALLLLAALLGLFKRGPLSTASVGSVNDPMQIEYQRFERLETPSNLRIILQPQVVNSNIVRLSVNSNYLNNFLVEQVAPEPESVEADGDNYTYVFKVSNLKQPVSINFHYTPEIIGFLKGEVKLENGQSFHFTQFVYP